MRLLCLLALGIGLSGCVVPVAPVLTFKIEEAVYVDPDPTSDWQLWKCTNVLSADTIEVQGGGVWVPVRLQSVRILDGKEKAAKEFLTAKAKGQIVRLQSDPRLMQRDARGLPMVYAWVRGWLLNEELIKAGLAVYDTTNGRSSLFDPQLSAATVTR